MAQVFLNPRADRRRFRRTENFPGLRGRPAFGVPRYFRPFSRVRLLSGRLTRPRNPLVFDGDPHRRGRICDRFRDVFRLPRAVRESLRLRRREPELPLARRSAPLFPVLRLDFAGGRRLRGPRHGGVRVGRVRSGRQLGEGERKVVRPRLLFGVRPRFRDFLGNVRRIFPFFRRQSRLPFRKRARRLRVLRRFPVFHRVRRRPVVRFPEMEERVPAILADPPFPNRRLAGRRLPRAPGGRGIRGFRDRLSFGNRPGVFRPLVHARFRDFGRRLRADGFLQPGVMGGRVDRALPPVLSLPSRIRLLEIPVNPENGTVRIPVTIPDSPIP